MRLTVLSLLAGFGLLALPRVAEAQGIYRYVEKDGTIVYTNVPPGAGKGAQMLKGTFHRAPGVSGGKITPQRLTASQYDEYVENAAKRYKLPVHLVKAIMHTESNFDPNAVSPKGASGLMQLMPKTAEEMYVKDIFDIRENIEGGARYLRVLANQFNGEMVKMVAAYNAGPDAVLKYGGNVPPYPETQAYVRKVIALYFKYKEQARLAQTEQPRK